MPRDSQSVVKNIELLLRRANGEGPRDDLNHLGPVSGWRKQKLALHLESFLIKI